MQTLKKIISFYINSSISVAIASTLLTLITQKQHHLSNTNLIIFIFFGTLVSYNVTKHRKLFTNSNTKPLAILTTISVVVAAYYYLKLPTNTQYVIIALGIITLLYTYPIPPNTQNIRNTPKIKIHLVTISWTLTTVILPLLNTFQTTQNLLLQILQRLLFLYPVLLIFEIVDLRYDPLTLKTIPQQIGIAKTKKTATIALFFFFVCQFFIYPYSPITLSITLTISLITLLFLLYASPNQPHYYSTLWVEGIPIIWFLLQVLLN